MKVKSFLAKPFASYVHRQVKKDMANAVEDQQKILQDLLKIGAKTIFGVDHKLAEVKTYMQNLHRPCLSATMSNTNPILNK